MTPDSLRDSLRDSQTPFAKRALRVFAEGALPPPFARVRPRLRGRRGQGIRYERKLHKRLSEEYGDLFVPGPWIRYSLADSERLQWAQPDGLLLDPEAGTCLVVEAKYSHTADAYHQLLRYKTLVQRILPEWEVRGVEVVKWYDPAVSFPAPVTILSAVDEESEEFGVWIWKG